MEVNLGGVHYLTLSWRVMVSPMGCHSVHGTAMTIAMAAHGIVMAHHGLLRQ